jgi:zinc protease
MMKKIIVILMLLLLTVPVTICALEVKEYRLENGLKVLIVGTHKAPVATLQVWYRTGSRDEPTGKSGLSHPLEHMMFKGTSRYGPSVFSKIIQKYGGTDNTYTTKDYTVYFELFSSNRILLAIDLEVDRMENLILDPKEVLSERRVVMEERRLRYEGDPQNSLFEEVVAAAFKVHPYHSPVIGWMSDLASIERDDLYKYYKANYSPSNAIIVIVGDIKADQIIKDIKNSFGKVHPVLREKDISSSEPEQRGERRVLLKRDAVLPYILVAYHTPAFPHEDSYALDVLSVILSGGKSSRLYKSLVYENKIALDVDADYDGLNNDPYLFFLDATVSPGKTIDEVEQALCIEIAKIKKEPPTELEIQKAKNQVEVSFVIEQDSIYLEAMKYGMFEILGDWRLVERYLDGIRKVTPEDVTIVAKKYFGEDNRTVGILIPTQEAKSE